MYTTGQPTTTTEPNQVEFAGGVRIEPYVPWIRRMIRHYANPGLDEKMCMQYNRVGDPSSNILFTAHEMPAQRYCYGALISPRFVLTTTECAINTVHVKVLDGPTIRNSKSQSFEITRVHYEELDVKIALLELNGEVSPAFSSITCLWNGTSARNFTRNLSARKESLVQQSVGYVQFHPDAPTLQVRYRCSSPGRDNWYTLIGDLVGVHVAGEPRPRIVGLLDRGLPCDYYDHFHPRQRTTEIINVQWYLPWIEDIAWRNGTGLRG